MSGMLYSPIPSPSFLPFYGRGGIIAAQTNVDLFLHIFTGGSVTMPQGGRILGGVHVLSSVVTAGTLTFNFKIGGSIVGTYNATTGGSTYTLNNRFNAGDLLNVSYTTDGAFAGPGTIYITPVVLFD